MSELSCVLKTMVVVDDRSKKNIHVVDNKYPYLIISILHALISLCMVCKQIIARDSDFDWTKWNDFRTKQ